MKYAPIQTQFNGGELSPFITGRVDTAKYVGGCFRMLGFIPTIPGPAIASPGTWFVQEAKNSDDRIWLMRFEFAADDSYMLEFGDGYIRFYFNRAQAQVSGVTAWSAVTAYAAGDPASRLGVNYYCKVAHTNQQPPNATYWYPLTGTIYEIPSPYSVADLTNDDGTFALRFVQTNDVIYIAHADHAPRKLSRFSATRWTLAAVDFVPPPFADQNATATTLKSSAATGSVTLTASASVFSSDMVGQYVYLQEKDVRDVQQWEAAKAVALNALRRSDGKNYQALNAATTGTVKPTHASGAAYDGDGAVQWQFLDHGFGIAKITAYSSPTSVTATVIDRIPDGAVHPNVSTRWALQAWNDSEGWPEAVTFFRERLVFARKDKLWFSVAADFESFAYQIDGVVTADAGFDRRLSSDRANPIRWLSPGDVLLVGTLGDEWAIVEATTSDPFGPGNCNTKRQSSYGSSRVCPVRAGSDTLFVQKSGRKVRAMAFRFEEDGFKSPNIAEFAGHITKPSLVDIAYQQEPWSAVWAVRSDGVLAGCVFDRDQEVVAWFRRAFDGGVAECVETIPAPDGTRDDPWFVVRYTIDGSTKRYIAYLAEEDDETGSMAQEDWAYSDMMLKYDGAPATHITGLDHLEGKEVWVLADGGEHPNLTVESGAIDLELAASVVIVGLPSEAYLETMPFEGGSGNGTGQGKTKRIHDCTVRVLRSLAWVAGPDDDHLQEGLFRSPETPLGTAPPPYTGDVSMNGWQGDYSSRATVVLKKQRPMPVTVVAVMPQMVVSEGK